MFYTEQELNTLSYRELQAIAKQLRDEGLLPESFKLNCKKQNLIDAIAMLQKEQISTVDQDTSFDFESQNLEQETQETSNDYTSTVTYPYPVSNQSYSDIENKLIHNLENTKICTTNNVRNHSPKQSINFLSLLVSRLFAKLLNLKTLYNKLKSIVFKIIGQLLHKEKAIT